MSNHFFRLLTSFLLLFFGASTLSAQTATNTSAAKEPARGAYLDPSLPLEQRLNDLVSRMTLEEKASQMQDVAPAIPRLGIPAYNWWNEGLHGVARSGNATVFPQAIGLAATWDTDLIHRVADVISTEARAKYNDAIQHGNNGRYFGLTFWSPNINIFRDPRWGRGQETYGEDPYLTSRIGVAFVTGLQGNDPNYLKTVSTPKPFALRNRLLSNDDLDRAVKRLFEARFRLGMFDPPDRVPWSKLSLADNDTPAHRQVALEAARKSIVLLKNEHNTLPLKPSVKTIAVIGPNADSLSVLLGNYNGNPSSYTTILDGLRKHFHDAKILNAMGSPITDTSAVLLPSAYLRTGGANSRPGLNAEYFSNVSLSGSPVRKRVDAVVDFEWNHVSPGPGVPAWNYSVRWSGELVPPVEGDYRLGASTDGGYRIYLDGKKFIDDSAPHGTRTMTTLVHLQAGHAYPIRMEYFHTWWESTARLLWLSPNLSQDAVNAARKADVVIAVVGITPQFEGEESDSSDPGFFGGDRLDLNLPRPQQELLESLAVTRKPLIVVLTNGSALAVNWAQQHAAAIVEAWYPGEEGGAAVAEVLSGDYNPAGRLPVTFYQC